MSQRELNGRWYVYLWVSPYVCTRVCVGFCTQVQCQRTPAEGARSLRKTVIDGELPDVGWGWTWEGTNLGPLKEQFVALNC